MGRYDSIAFVLILDRLVLMEYTCIYDATEKVKTLGVSKNEAIYPIR